MCLEWALNTTTTTATVLKGKADNPAARRPHSQIHVQQHILKRLQCPSVRCWILSSFGAAVSSSDPAENETGATKNTTQKKNHIPLKIWYFHISLSRITLSKPRSSISHTTGRSASTGTHDLWMRNASTHRISTTSKTYSLSPLCTRAPSFFSSLWLTGRMRVPGRVPDREIYIVKSLIYSHRGKATRKRSYFSPAEHLPAVMEERGPNHLTSGVENFLVVVVVVVVVQRMPSSLCQGLDNHLIQAYVCVMDLSWHTRRNVVGNKVIN